MTITVEDLEREKRLQALKDDIAGKAGYIRVQVSQLEKVMQVLEDEHPSEHICDFNIGTHIKRAGTTPGDCPR